jgi:uncharacterized repeat protein (TIGR03803 family)
LYQAVIVACLSLTSLASPAAQIIQPIYSFTNGPAYPYAGVTLGPDGNYYGTTRDGGVSDIGTVFRVTTNGMVTTLVSFANTNGANPQAALTLAPDGNFYGTTYNGGGYGEGTIFRITTNGALTVLHSFGAIVCGTSVCGNVDGANPFAGLTLGPDGNLYGTAIQGGTNGVGTVYQITTNGAFTTLANFAQTNGEQPYAGLTFGPDGNLYGTTLGGGSGGYGTVFQITTNGTLTTLTNFNKINGAEPYSAALALGPDGNFYGTTEYGGISNNGTVFQVTTNGALTTLHSFGATNAEGANPTAGLSLGPDGNFYGTTQDGGNFFQNGTVFRITTNGTFTTLIAFAVTNGAFPIAGLTLGPDGNFYGTAQQGGGAYYGAAGYGTVFQITTNGALTTLASFTNAAGLNPYAGLTLGPDGNLYGTARNGGIAGIGSVFRVTTNGALITIASFTNTYINGENPYAALTMGPDGNFYGTTPKGGSNSDGTVFRVTTSGVLTQLAGFRGTNGATPYAALTLGPDGNFYGTTVAGGSTTNGTVFQITTSGALTTLARFTKTNGANPYAALTLGPDGNFYGTTYSGGTNNTGTVFQITTNGALTSLYSFASGFVNPAYPAGLTLGPDGNLYGTSKAGYDAGGYNSETVFRITTAGALTPLTNFPNGGGTLNPYAALTLGSDGSFYSTTVFGGGPTRFGTAFRVTTNGVLTSLGTFTNVNGANPYSTLTVGPDGNFYGTTDQGGAGGGVIYRLNLPPSITSQPASETVPIGSSALFAVGAFGTPPLAYQWYFDTNTQLTGDNNSALGFAPVLANEAGSYQVIVTSPYGSATSSVAGLTVLIQPNCYAISNSGPGSMTLLLASAPNSTNRLWATTNVSLPLAQWQLLSTNTADATGLFQFTDTNTGAIPARFYILSSP